MQIKKALLLALLITAIFLGAKTMNTASDHHQQQAQQMVATINQIVLETADQIGRDHFSERVLNAMSTVPRHRFVPASSAYLAYSNRPLAIGHQQTISQPYIVALMTDLLNPQADQTILEIGTGSGYQAAVLSRLVKQVYSIEIVPELAATAAQVLSELGYENIEVKAGNGYLGWPEHAPFDGIIVTAGGEIPPLLLEQLKPGGRMIIPVGGQHQAQYLTVLKKDINGEIEGERLLPVRFVPLIGGEE